jgi:hypothetical protein
MQVTIEPQCTSSDLAREICPLWIDSPESAASRRTWTRLSGYGVPGGATTLRVTDEGTLLLPFFAALIRGQAGNRITMAEAVTGQFDPILSSAFTQYALICSTCSMRLG